MVEASRLAETERRVRILEKFLSDPTVGGGDAAADALASAVVSKAEETVRSLVSRVAYDDGEDINCRTPRAQDQCTAAVVRGQHIFGSVLRVPQERISGTGLVTPRSSQQSAQVGMRHGAPPRSGAAAPSSPRSFGKQGRPDSSKQETAASVASAADEVVTEPGSPKSPCNSNGTSGISAAIAEGLQQLDPRLAHPLQLRLADIVHAVDTVRERITMSAKLNAELLLKTEERRRLLARLGDLEVQNRLFLGRLTEDEAAVRATEGMQMEAHTCEERCRVAGEDVAAQRQLLSQAKASVAKLAEGRLREAIEVREAEEALALLSKHVQELEEVRRLAGRCCEENRNMFSKISGARQGPPRWKR
mmetsp:Transcript_72654/g.163162  ORF Transcript_72654/g.163162 Transcript_72654/m.163162 type:complete len:362 (+) Transcript_72654:70-1155(+)